MNQQERDEYLAIEWTGPGWKQLILDCDRELAALDPEYTIDQIKEKFGGLRYYVTPSEGCEHNLWEIAERYERRSYSTCEACGATLSVLTANSPGTTWVKSLCSSCREQGVTRC